MLTGLDFPGSRKNFPFPGKKFPDRENFGKLQNPYQACLCNSNSPPPTLTHATMSWTGGEAYTHGDCLLNDRTVAAVKIRQYWHWNNSALYSRSPDIRPPKAPFIATQLNSTQLPVVDLPFWTSWPSFSSLWVMTLCMMQNSHKIHKFVWLYDRIDIMESWTEESENKLIENIAAEWVL